MPVQTVVTEILNCQILCVKDYHSKSRIRQRDGKVLQQSPLYQSALIWHGNEHIAIMIFSQRRGR